MLAVTGAGPLLWHVRPHTRMEQSSEKITAFGWDWRVGLPQILLLLSVVLASYGTWRAVRSFHGWTLVGWILLCWLLPIVGALIVVQVSRRQRASSRP